jgi:hypothetical protein
MIGTLTGPLHRARDLNAKIQDALRAWGDASADDGSATRAASGRRGTMLDQSQLPWFAALNRGLRDTLDDAAFEARLRDNVAQLELLAAEIMSIAAAARADVPLPESSLLQGMAA